MNWINTTTLPPRNWLVGEWKLDGNALDTNDGTKNNGTATNVTYTNTDRGYQKQAWVFNGSSSWISIASISGVRTLSFWIKPTSNTKTILTLVTTTSLITLDWSGNVAQTWLTNSAIFINWASATLTTLNSWNYVTITCDAKTLSNFNIWSSSFAWNIQWVRVFNRVLNSTEINTLYLEWLRKLNWESMSGLMDGLVAYYDFAGDANDVVWGNNGTVTGATLTTDHLWFANRAYSFNWRNLISITNAWQFSFDNKPFSVCMNIYPTSWSTSGTHTLIDFEKAWWIWWLLRHEMNNNYLSGNNDQQLSTSLPNINEWTTVIFTSNWTNWKVYFNWSLNYTQNTLTYNWNSTTAYWIWNNAENTLQWFIWKIAHTSIFNRELSATEVKAISDLLKLKYVYPYK